MQRISTPHAPAPGGHYTQGVVHGGFLFVSGQLPIDPATGERCLESIEAQTQRALENVAGIVRAAGGDLTDVLKTTVYVSDIDLWGRVNQTYAAFFGEHRPARAVVPTKELHHGFQIEIEAVARVP